MSNQAFKYPVFMGEEHIVGGSDGHVLEWSKYQHKQVRFETLCPGDRFLTVDALWTKLGPHEARMHSDESRCLGEDGHGQHSDAVLPFEQDDVVAFVAPVV